MQVVHCIPGQDHRNLEKSGGFFVPFFCAFVGLAAYRRISMISDPARADPWYFPYQAGSFPSLPNHRQNLAVFTLSYQYTKTSGL
jgi:hypothetical protein